MRKSDINALIGIQMSKTMLSMKRYIISEFESVDSAMSFEDWMNLLPLLEENNLSQKDLARILGKDKTTISRLISQWLKNGYVSILKSEHDSRVNLILMTPKAIKLHKDLQSIVQKADLLFTKSFGKSDIASITSYLKKISENL